MSSSISLFIFSEESTSIEYSDLVFDMEESTSISYTDPVSYSLTDWESETDEDNNLSTVYLYDRTLGKGPKYVMPIDAVTEKLRQNYFVLNHEEQKKQTKGMVWYTMKQEDGTKWLVPKFASQDQLTKSAPVEGMEVKVINDGHFSGYKNACTVL